MKDIKEKIEITDAKSAKWKIEINVTYKNYKTRDWETLEEVQDYPRLTISADYGQCYDSIHPANKAQRDLIAFWKEHHLNDLTTGTKKQLDYLKKNFDYHTLKYDDAVEALKKVGLYEDRGYKYGTKWLYRSFPVEKLKDIIKRLRKAERDRRYLAKKKSRFDIDDESGEMLEYVTEEFCYGDEEEAKRKIALTRYLGNEVSDIDYIESQGGCVYSTSINNYYVGTWDELNDLVRELLNDDPWLWKDAVAADRTIKGLDDWIDDVLNYDGFASVLGSYDGCHYEETVNGEDFYIVRQ